MGLNLVAPFRAATGAMVAVSAADTATAVAAIPTAIAMAAILETVTGGTSIESASGRASGSTTPIPITVTMLRTAIAWSGYAHGPAGASAESGCAGPITRFYVGYHLAGRRLTGGNRHQGLFHDRAPASSRALPKGRQGSASGPRDSDDGAAMAPSECRSSPSLGWDAQVCTHRFYGNHNYC